MEENNIRNDVIDNSLPLVSLSLRKTRSLRQSESGEDGTEWSMLQSLVDDSVLSNKKHGKPSHIFSKSFEQIVSRQVTVCKSAEQRRKELVKKWKSAARLAASRLDPWIQFNFDTLPVRNCNRHQYSSIRDIWTSDQVEVKLHSEAFARGAMRECYRMKKLSSFSRSKNWSHAQNYVAKKYINEVDREIIFEDVKLQMDSKLWAEEYNRHSPPKKIDIFKVCVLEFTDGEKVEYYHLEHFIEGEYIKYNSNSGFVSEVARNTPQAFSHFTFERSGHQLIVVDIQGVGDLYTDPQVHTEDGKKYGDGNLGTKGMALFFQSHKCNEICFSLSLTEFDLHESEKLELEERKKIELKDHCSFTVYSNDDKISPCSPLIRDVEDNAMERLRYRTLSMNDSEKAYSTASSCGDLSIEDYRTHRAGSVHFRMSESDSWSGFERGLPVRKCYYGSFESHGDEDDEDTDGENYWIDIRKKSLPAGLLSDTQLRELEDVAAVGQHSSVLGQIHLNLARYHELGRFVSRSSSVSSDKENHMNSSEGGDGMTEKSFKYNKEAALFHLNCAERCGILEAILTIAEMAYGLSHDLLKDVENPYFSCIEDREGYGLDLMERAANLGDIGAILFVAEAYETGRNLGKDSLPCWPKAIERYKQAACLDTFDEDEKGVLAKPRYEILQKMADMYKEGGYGLNRNLTNAFELYNEAAECAMEAMKGKLATKLYEMAEQCV